MTPTISRERLLLNRPDVCFKLSSTFHRDSGTVGKV